MFNMESRINYHIRDLYMIKEKTIPPMLHKHLTNKIFEKPNKEAMEQVLFYLLPLVNPNCFKTIPWPITSFKEAAEFRNTATLIINGLDGFEYKKSSNVVMKVNSSLLANPGGPTFVNFMYQLCSYIVCHELNKKGINVINAPSNIEDNYIDYRIAMFDRISKSNFDEVNEKKIQVDFSLKTNRESTVKYKEIIQDSKKAIKDFSSELQKIEHCKATEKELAELENKNINLYNNFEQNKLIAIKCTKLADIILTSPIMCDANIINLNPNINKVEVIDNDEKLDLVKLLTTIKTNLNNYINWCEQLKGEEEIEDNILKLQQSVLDMTEQLQSYEQHMKTLNNIIDNLNIENQDLKTEVFSSENITANIHPIFKSVYTKNPSIVLKTDFTDKPAVQTSENKKYSRRSILLLCSQPYSYQKISFNDIKEVYKATLPKQDKYNILEQDTSENLNESTLSDSYQPTQDTSFHNNEIKNSQSNTFANSKNQSLMIAQIKEEEVKKVHISRRSIENIKQRFNRIKNQSQEMNTIPHSPRSPI